MASEIVPDRQNPAAPKTGRPDAAPAAAGRGPSGTPPARQAAARGPARPAPSRPQGQPATAAAEPAHGDDAAARRAGATAGGFLRHTPAWLVSMLVHIVGLLAMALVAIPAPVKDAPRVITSTPAEDAPMVEDSFEELEVVELTEVPDVSDPLAPTDVSVVEDVKVIANADDLDAAPLAVELTDFGSQTAPAADMLATVGAVGGTAGGFGGRAKAAQLAATGGGSPDSEAAVEAALKWFSIHQRPDGSWTTQFDQCPSCQGKCGNSGNRPNAVDDPAGATALALLPFLGRGYTHKEGPYKQTVERGLAYLAGTVIANRGQAYEKRNNHGGYVQAVTAIVLCEAYGMSQDARLAGPSQLALNFIHEAQDPRGGGWMYRPKSPGCTSVTAFTLMALKSGHMAYLQINPLTIAKASAFLDSVSSDNGSQYGYMDSSPRPTLGPPGILCRMYLGWKKDHPAIEKAVARLAAKGPDKENMYYNYYATQVLHHYGGDPWIAWNNRMRDLLVSKQSKTGHEAGSWHFNADFATGRIFTTSLSTLILEVYYRHMPIYQQHSVDDHFKE
jgi:hypothetical protein